MFIHSFVPFFLFFFFFFFHLSIFDFLYFSNYSFSSFILCSIFSFPLHFFLLFNSWPFILFSISIFYFLFLYFPFPLHRVAGRSLKAQRDGHDHLGLGCETTMADLSSYSFFTVVFSDMPSSCSAPLVDILWLRA